MYRRLKLKAKKEVGIWLKACVDSGADIPAPGSNVIRPDDTSFLVYEMIKPFKEELNPDDKEHERLLAEARKNRCAVISFALSGAKEEKPNLNCILDKEYYLVLPLHRCM